MLFNRMRRAALLDARLYDEMAHDTSATGQAFQAALLAAGASALYMLIVLAMVGHPRAGVAALIVKFAGGLLSWLVWAYVTYILGVRLPGRTVPLGAVLRALGFALSPQILTILGAVPLLGILILLAVPIWVLVTGVVAVRQILEVSTGKAVGIAMPGWIAMLALSFMTDSLLDQLIAFGSLLD